MGKGTEALAARRAMGYAAQEVDAQAVALFVAQAQGADAGQRAQVVDRLVGMIGRGERAKGPNGYVSLETMAAAADEIEAL